MARIISPAALTTTVIHQKKNINWNQVGLQNQRSTGLEFIVTRDTESKICSLPEREVICDLT